MIKDESMCCCVNVGLIFHGQLYRQSQFIHRIVVYPHLLWIYYIFLLRTTWLLPLAAIEHQVGSVWSVDCNRRGLRETSPYAPPLQKMLLPWPLPQHCGRSVPTVTELGSTMVTARPFEAITNGPPPPVFFLLLSWAPSSPLPPHPSPRVFS